MKKTGIRHVKERDGNWRDMLRVKRGVMMNKKKENSREGCRNLNCCIYCNGSIGREFTVLENVQDVLEVFGI